MKNILLAFQFLTIFPVKDTGIASEKEVGGAAAFFPLVGVFQGAVLIPFAMMALRFLPADVVNIFVILLLIVMNGGLHLDGLSDTFDAIASRGDRDKKLLIMKDATTGPIGVTAIVIAILLKLFLLDEIYSSSRPETYYLLLFLLPVYSRWAMVPAIYHGRAARQDGLGKAFIENAGVRELLISTVLTLIFSLLAVFIFFNRPDLAHVISSLPALYIFSLIAVWLSGRRFGGMTGDTFGAVSELSEILFLMMAVICLRNFSL